MPTYKWGLWGVRRGDLFTVWCAGFDYIRTAYPAAESEGFSGSWTYNNQTVYFDHTDNYLSTLNYAHYAQQIGFTKLIYDLGLKWLYAKYRRTVVEPGYGANNPNIPKSIQDIKDEVSNRIGYMSQGGYDPVTQGNLTLNQIICHPYIDEPEYFPQEREEDEEVELWPDYIYDIETIHNWPDPPQEPSLSYNAINRDIIAEFRDLVAYARDIANYHGRQLIIATTTPDIVRRCNPPTENCSSIQIYRRDDYAGYHYNSLPNIALMSSLYDTAAHMNPILSAIQSNYNKSVQQLINFWDYFEGCRNACTVQEIINQINVNTQYSGGENWFYQGDYIYLHKVVNGYDSFEQWQKLRQALAHYGTEPRCPVPE